MYFKIIQFNEKHWITVESNLPVLFKSYSCPILLVITEVYVYEKCDVLLNQKKNYEYEDKQNNSTFHCDRCCLWYHI